MTDNFLKYMEDQINVIRREIGDECDNEEVSKTRIIEWIEKNASSFRAVWERECRRKCKNVVG
jgi:hypothetical protein